MIAAVVQCQVRNRAVGGIVQLHEQTYRDLGFRLIDVPAGTLADRVALVKQTVERLRR